MVFLYVFTIFVAVFQCLDKIIVYVIEKFLDVEGRHRKFHNEIGGLNEQLSTMSATTAPNEVEALMGKIKRIRDNREIEERNIAKLRNNILRLVLTVSKLLCCAGCGLLISKGIEKPILRLNSSWLSPFGYLFAFPGSVDGAIGICAWFLIVKNAIAAFELT